MLTKMISEEFLKERVGQLLILKARIIFSVLRKIDFWKSFGPASKSLNQLNDHSLEISLFLWSIMVFLTRGWTIHREP